MDNIHEINIIVLDKIISEFINQINKRGSYGINKQEILTLLEKYKKTKNQKYIDQINKTIKDLQKKQLKSKDKRYTFVSEHNIEYYKLKLKEDPSYELGFVFEQYKKRFFVNDVYEDLIIAIHHYSHHIAKMSATKTESNQINPRTTTQIATINNVNSHEQTEGSCKLKPYEIDIAISNAPQNLDELKTLYIKLAHALKLRSKEKNNERMIKNTQQLMLRLYRHYISLETKSEKTPEEEKMLKTYLSHSQNVHKILMKYLKKYPEDNMMTTINTIMEKELDDCFGYYHGTPGVYSSHTQASTYFSNMVQLKTALMHPEDIVKLYKKYTTIPSEKYSRALFQKLEAARINFQQYFSDAILCNSACDEIIKRLSSKYDKIARYLICVNYFKELPTEFHNKQQLIDYIYANIKETKLAHKIVLYLNSSEVVHKNQQIDNSSQSPRKR